MYSVVLAAMLTTGAATPAWGWGGCYGGCYGNAFSCHGCYGNALSCYGCYGCNGCRGGACYGWGGCYGCYGYMAGAYYSNCYGCYGCYGSCSGCNGCYGSCYGCSGCYGSCYGCNGCYGCYGGSCYGGYGMFSCNGCSGCYGGVAMVAPPIIVGSAFPDCTYPSQVVTVGVPSISGGMSMGGMPKISGPASGGSALPAIASPPSGNSTPAIAPPVGGSTDQPKKITPPGGNGSVSSGQATLVVNLPADARLYVDGDYCPLTSSTRTFNSPAIEQGRRYSYTLKAEMVRDGKTQTETKTVVFEAGKLVQVNFEEPSRVQAARR